MMQPFASQATEPPEATAPAMKVKRALAFSKSVKIVRRRASDWSKTMRLMRLLVVGVAMVALISFVGSGAQAAPDRMNIRYVLTHLGSPDDPNFYNADPDDAAVFKKAGVYWRGGVPFFLHGRKGVFKSQPDATNNTEETVSADLLTTNIPNATGVFLLLATTGTLNRMLTSIGKVEYEFTDGSTLTGNILARDHYEVLDSDALQGLEIAESESEPTARYTTVNGRLARYNLTVLYHAFPKRTLKAVRILDTPDEGEGAEAVNAPVWVYVLTIATTP
jgi:hypothetical protein